MGNDRAAFAGQLSDLAVGDLFRTIVHGEQTGKAQFETNLGSATVWFREGTIVDADMGRFHMGDAVRRLLRADTGSFEVEFRPINRRQLVKETTAALLGLEDATADPQPVEPDAKASDSATSISDSSSEPDAKSVPDAKAEPDADGDAAADAKGGPKTRPRRSVASWRPTGGGQGQAQARPTASDVEVARAPADGGHTSGAASPDMLRRLEALRRVAVDHQAQSTDVLSRTQPLGPGEDGAAGESAAPQSPVRTGMTRPPIPGTKMPRGRPQTPAGDGDEDTLALPRNEERPQTPKKRALELAPTQPAPSSKTEKPDVAAFEPVPLFTTPAPEGSASVSAKKKGTVMGIPAMGPPAAADAPTNKTPPMTPPSGVDRTVIAPAPSEPTARATPGKARAGGPNKTQRVTDPPSGSTPVVTRSAATPVAASESSAAAPRPTQKPAAPAKGMTPVVPRHVPVEESAAPTKKPEPKPEPEPKATTPLVKRARPFDPRAEPDEPKAEDRTLLRFSPLAAKRQEAEAEAVRKSRAAGRTDPDEDAQTRVAGVPKDIDRDDLSDPIPIGTTWDAPAHIAAPTKDSPIDSDRSATAGGEIRPGAPRAERKVAPAFSPVGLRPKGATIAPAPDPGGTLTHGFRPIADAEGPAAPGGVSETEVPATAGTSARARASGIAAAIGMPESPATDEETTEAKAEEPPAAESATSGSSAPAVVGRYEVLLRIARGGMGTVYLCRVTGAGGFRRLFALKVIRDHLSRNEEYVRMLLQEARIASRLHHPNVVGIVDIGSLASQHYLVMDYVEGCTVSELLKMHPKSRPPQLIVPLVLDALTGLHAAHTLTDDDGSPLSLVHCDFSPQNMLLGTNGICRITDFGISKAARALPERSSVTRGKPAYLSPEQVTGRGFDARADIFAAGVVLWNALTGEQLFSGDTPEEILDKVLNLPLPAPSTVGLRPPRALDRVVLKALARDPEHRYQSAEEMLIALRRVAITEDLLAPSSDVARWVTDTFGAQLEMRRQAAGISGKPVIKPDALAIPELGLGADDSATHAVRTGGSPRADESASRTVMLRTGSAQERPRGDGSKQRAIIFGLAATLGGAVLAVAFMRPEWIQGGFLDEDGKYYEPASPTVDDPPPKADGGDTKAEGGDTKAEGGDTKAEGGDTKAEGGDAKAEGGDAKAEGGDVEEGGDTKAEGGEAEVESGDPEATPAAPADKPKPKADKPKPDRPKADKPKPDKPKPKADKPKPDKPKPKADKPEPDKPEPDKPKPELPAPPNLQELLDPPAIK